MKTRFFVLVLLVTSSCGGMLDYEPIPEYEDVSALITPEGNTVTALNHYISAPPGAVTENLYLRRPAYELVFNSDRDPRVPPFMFDANDNFLEYSDLITFQPVGYSFQKDVTLGFYAASGGPYAIHELRPGTDGSEAEHWVDRTAEVERIPAGESSTFATLKTRHLTKYLITSGPWFKNFYLDREPTGTWPSNGIKPVLQTSGKYMATVIDDHEETDELFGLQLYFVKPPTARTYSIVDMTGTGQLSNTSDAAMEILAYFRCTRGSTGNVNCSDVYVSKSGTFKYSFQTLSGGFVIDYVFFRDVVVRHRSTGEERTLNGYYELRN